MDKVPYWKQIVKVRHEPTVKMFFLAWLGGPATIADGLVTTLTFGYVHLGLSMNVSRIKARGHIAIAKNKRADEAKVELSKALVTRLSLLEKYNES